MRSIILSFCLILSAGYIFAQDGWTIHQISTDLRIEEIQFLNDTLGFACGVLGWGGELFKTTDQCVSWDTVSIWSLMDCWCCMYFYNENYGLGAGDKWPPFQSPLFVGSIALTYNGGLNWQLIFWNYYSFIRIHVEDSVKVWLLSENGILYTKDLFNTYDLQLHTQKIVFNNFYFTDSLNGWAVGRNTDHGGVLLFTTNGGDNWIYDHLMSEFMPEWRSVCFINPDIGWVVGDSGRIFRTTDHGVSWTEQVSGTDLRLNDVYFYNKYMGWTVGDSGIILYTENGGSTWINQISGVQCNLYNVFFLDSIRGWIGGDSGYILYTTNSGVSVEEKPPVVSDPVSFQVIYNLRTVSLIVNFNLNQDDFVECVLYNLSGQKIKEIVGGRFSSGENNLTVDLSCQGTNISSGKYFVRFETSSGDCSTQSFIVCQ